MCGFGGIEYCTLCRLIAPCNKKKEEQETEATREQNTNRVTDSWTISMFRNFPLSVASATIAREGHGEREEEGERRREGVKERDGQREGGERETGREKEEGTEEQRGGR